MPLDLTSMAWHTNYFIQGFILFTNFYKLVTFEKIDGTGWMFGCDKITNFFVFPIFFYGFYKDLKAFLQCFYFVKTLFWAIFKGIILFFWIFLFISSHWCFDFTSNCSQLRKVSHLKGCTSQNSNCVNDVICLYFDWLKGKL